MRTRVSLRRLRGFAICRMAAVVLLVLVLTPFTAPFSTFDLADLTGGSPLHGDLISSSKTAKHASIDVAAPTHLALVANDLAPAVLCTAGENTRFVPQFVLRL